MDDDKQDINIPFKPFFILWVICFAIDIGAMSNMPKLPVHLIELFTRGVMLGDVILFSMLIWNTPSMRSALTAAADQARVLPPSRAANIVKHPPIFAFLLAVLLTATVFVPALLVATFLVPLI